MKDLAFAVVITTALAFTTNAFAQQPAPLATAGIQGPRPLHGARGPREQGLRPVTTIQGKVVKLRANDDFTFDGFYLLSGSDSLLIRFPANMGTQIQPVAKTGSQISASGVLKEPPFGTKELRMVSLTAGDKTLTETVPMVPPADTQESIRTGSGKISALQTNREGMVTGIFTDNKTLLRFPPHIGSQLGNLAAKGSTISYTGTQKSKIQGEVQLEDYKVIHCNSITVNGQQYLIK